MSERIFAPELGRAAARGAPAALTIEGGEAHHLVRVLRARPGLRVLLFDGAGLERWAEVERAGKREVEVRLVDGECPGRAPRARLGLAVAPPRGKRMRWLVEKATELGAAALIPLLTARGVVDPEARADHKQGKWRQAAIEAAKQCGALWLPAIAEPAALGPALGAAARLCVLLDPRAESGLATVLGAGALAGPAPPAAGAGAPLDVLFVVGPEGGFTDDERAAARAAGAVEARLGPLILRVETAALAALAVARALLE